MDIAHRYDDGDPHPLEIIAMMAGGDHPTRLPYQIPYLHENGNAITPLFKGLYRGRTCYDRGLSIVRKGLGWAFPIEMMIGI